MCDCCQYKIVAPDSRHGSHISLGPTLYDTMKYSRFEDLGIKCRQIYLTGHANFKMTKFSQDDIAKTRKYHLNNDLNFYVHCPVNANLAKDECSASFNIVKNELLFTQDLPAACVLHVGTLGTVENVATRINELEVHNSLKMANYDRVPYNLLLETSAGQGSSLGKTWEELRRLYEGLDKTRIGLCIDTQHIFASGMNKLETHQDVVNLWDAADDITGHGFTMVHLNDSKKDFNSRVDRHESLYKGKIWYSSDESLKSLLSICRDCARDVISETPTGYADVEIMNKLSDPELSI